MKYKIGDEVVIVEEEPDPNFKDDGIPVGVTGVIVGIYCESTHPVYGDIQQLYDVLLDCPYEEQSFCEDVDGKAKATLFESMIELNGTDEIPVDFSALDDFLS